MVTAMKSKHSKALDSFSQDSLEDDLASDSAYIRQHRVRLGIDPLCPRGRDISRSCLMSKTILYECIRTVPYSNPTIAQSTLK